MAFPSKAPIGTSKAVDQFYACALGQTAVEFREDEAANYSALYTEAMLQALSGQRRELLRRGTDPDKAYYVDTRQVASFLKAEIPQVVLAKGLENRVSQSPDDIIVTTSSWLASHPRLPRLGAGGDDQPPVQPVNLGTVTHSLIATAVTGTAQALEAELTQARDDQTVPGATVLAETVSSLSMPFGPEKFESHCGLKVQGAEIKDAVAHGCDVARVSADVIRFWNVPQTGASVVVEFANGTGTVLAALPEYIAALTVDNGRLVDVSYEPSENSWRWQQFVARKDQLRALRAVIAAASSRRQFRLTGETAGAMARQMRVEKSVDPSLGIYSAYAYADLGDTGQVLSIHSFLRDDPQIRLFDIDLLAGVLDGKPLTALDGVVPFVPMLGQGWALLPAHNVRMHPSLAGVEQSVQQSLWTLLAATGLRSAKEAVATGEVL